MRTMWPSRMDFGYTDETSHARRLIEATPFVEVAAVRRAVADVGDAVAIVSGRGRRLSFVATRDGEERIVFATMSRTGSPLLAELVARPGTLGGRRWFAICPRCERRTLYLFQRGERLACRTCHGLAYASQRLDPHWRAFFVCERLEGRFYDPDGRRVFEDRGLLGLWEKPPRMRWSTFGRLWAKYAKASSRYLAWSGAGSLPQSVRARS